jgi:dynein heavy chain, axonemal
MHSRRAKSGPPPSFWLPALAAPRAFFTALRQRAARRAGVALEDVSLLLQPARQGGTDAAAAPPLGEALPDGAARVHGLLLAGAAWDATPGALCEAAPRQQLGAPAPDLLVCPVVAVASPPAKEARGAGSAAQDAGGTGATMYECPLYLPCVRYPLPRHGGRTASAAGAHAERGDVVAYVRLPSAQPAEHWALRGAALLPEPAA